MVTRGWVVSISHVAVQGLEDNTYCFSCRRSALPHIMVVRHFLPSLFVVFGNIKLIFASFQQQNSAQRVTSVALLLVLERFCQAECSNLYFFRAWEWFCSKQLIFISTTAVMVQPHFCCMHTSGSETSQFTSVCSISLMVLPSSRTGYCPLSVSFGFAETVPILYLLSRLLHMINGFLPNLSA